ncbi:MAG: hypothetical protein JST28_12545 [Acidobacteria bacterium]|nr:hypothetical protein [Acidobacteriota bacterium]
MTLHGIDLIVVAVMIAGGFSICYLLVARNLRAILGDRNMKVADHIGKLDDAIRALETRLAEHQSRGVSLEQARKISEVQVSPSKSGEFADHRSEEDSEIAPEIHAVIAAAAVAAVGPNAVVNSVKSAPSPWTQQGRVLVQGGHNLRVQR